MSDDNQENDKRNSGFYIAVVVLVSYIVSYALFCVWLLFDGLINEFSAIGWVWGLDKNVSFDGSIQLAFYTSLGAVLGGAILSITSFHRYVAIEKKFDVDHLWGFILNPLLSGIVGLIVYALLQSGLIVLTGSFTGKEQLSSASFGFTAIGCIAGYNWDVFITKLEELSKNLFKNKGQE